MMLVRVLAALLLAISVTSRAQIAPSVWDQLQLREGSSNSITAKLLGLHINNSNRAIVEFIEKGAGLKGSVELCRNKSNIENDSWSAAVNMYHLQDIRETVRSGEYVQMYFAGPWSPCLSSISTLK